MCGTCRWAVWLRMARGSACDPVAVHLSRPGSVCSQPKPGWRFARGLNSVTEATLSTPNDLSPQAAKAHTLKCPFLVQGPIFTLQHPSLGLMEAG